MSATNYDRVVGRGLKLKKVPTDLVVVGKKKKKKRRRLEKLGGDGNEFQPQLVDEDGVLRNEDEVHGKPPSECTSKSVSDPDAKSDSLKIVEKQDKSISNESDDNEFDTNSERDDDVTEFLKNANPNWTPAEKSFYLSQKIREKAMIQKKLTLTHRQRMEKFNAHLSTLSEHFDQPRVGPG